MKFKQFFAGILATMFFLLLTSSAFATDPPGKKTDPGKVTPGYYSNLEISVKANTASTVVNPETGTTTLNSDPFFLEGNDLKTEVSLQYSSGQLTLVTISRQSRIDGVLYRQTLILYPEDQSKNTSIGVGNSTASNVIMEINRASQLKNKS